jgi:hypothetical protein
MQDTFLQTKTDQILCLSSLYDQNRREERRVPIFFCLPKSKRKRGTYTAELFWMQKSDKLHVK